MAYLHNDYDTFRYLVVETQRHFNLPEEYVVKDYFIYVLLREIVAAKPTTVFKGGTSLSKAHRLIDRFSEDLDIGIATNSTEGIRRKMKHAICDAVETTGLSISNIDRIKSKKLFNRYTIPLPVFTINNNTLAIESSFITPVHPIVDAHIDSLIYQYCIQATDMPDAARIGIEPFAALASSVERSFVDKVYAICDYYLEGKTTDRQSRHIYDLWKMFPKIEFNSDLAELFQDVRAEREASIANCPSADEGVSLVKTVQQIAQEQIYKPDYETITENLLFEQVGYNQAAQALEKIIEFLDAFSI